MNENKKNGYEKIKLKTKEIVFEKKKQKLILDF